MHYLSNILGIKDPIHKQKIALKAMDVVLFGPPKGNVASLFIARTWQSVYKPGFISSES